MKSLSFPLLALAVAYLVFFGYVALSYGELPEKIASAVDGQMDDGVPSTGTVRAQLQTAPNPDTLATSNAPAYVETGVNQYLMCKNY